MYQCLNGAIPSRKCSIKAPAKWRKSAHVLTVIYHQRSKWLGPKSEPIPCQPIWVETSGGPLEKSMCLTLKQYFGESLLVNIMKLDVWVLVTLSAILGLLFFGSLIWLLIKIVRKFLKNNNDANSLPQNEAISNQPLMEVSSVQKITLLPTSLTQPSFKN